MKFKHQVAVFSILTRIVLIVVLWFVLPVLVEKVVFRHITTSLLEKREKFIRHLDKDEINEFLSNNDLDDTYASFSKLHSEFLQLSRLPDDKVTEFKTVFVTEPRIIEDEENEYRILQYSFKYEGKSYLLEIGNNLAQVKDLYFVIRFFTVAVLIGLILLTFLLEAFYIDYLLRPFYKIIDRKIRHIDDPETYNNDTIKTHSDDFKELDQALDQMMDRMLDVLQKEKQFIANVSHELLTPIAILRSRFENLLQNESIDNDGLEKIVSSLKTLDNLKKIINNLLLISKVENHKFQADETIVLQELLNELLGELDDRIKDKEITVISELKQQYIFKGNRTLMHILLFNLLVNALKYNKEGGSIIFTDGFEEGKYWLAVTDTGKGIPADMTATLFDRFTRINLQVEGQGLGLAIANSIARFHNCNITVRSVENAGSTFTVHFKLPEK
ncbi:sensor histidine kinase [Flavobacterium cerinum]|uniref:histidine kinase n=1 Tax=Flavobacterium cerinum TaxID=2502784 RepID=A0ABY5IYT3_9FLAO|nr:HAMP domain-containing sensor histidine kinase [Flavobacterium cerinum]UUC46656.1 HAMP domain-containing histidine kinase [Flavobacterium cerinum]